MTRRTATGSRSSVAQVGTGHPFGPPPCILVVDDEVTIVSLLATVLDDEGFRVIRAYDGEEAWGLVVQHRPQLVITDVSMPKLSGIDLLRRIRSVHALAPTPVILMSAAFRIDDDDSTTFLPKPFDLGPLLQIVKQNILVPN